MNINVWTLLMGYFENVKWFLIFAQEHKVLLTGTPLQNTVEELFSLLNFLEPDRFPSEITFMQEFGDLKTEEQVQDVFAWLLHSVCKAHQTCLDGFSLMDFMFWF